MKKITIFSLVVVTDLEDHIEFQDCNFTLGFVIVFCAKGFLLSFG